MCVFICVYEREVGWSSGLRLIGEGRQCVPAGRVYVCVCVCVIVIVIVFVGSDFR